MKKISFVLALLGIAACSSTYDVIPDNPNILPFKDSKTSSTGGTNLIDHGGRVLPISNTYVIWWGNQSAFPSDAKAGINSLLEGLNGSQFLGISSQYMRGTSSSTSFHTNWTDTSSPPWHAPNSALIVSEACKVIVHNGASPDPNAIYFVFTSNFPNQRNYCAWHGDGACDGVTIQVAYMPNATGIGGCDPGNLYKCNSYSQGTRALANIASHEYMETITDPELNAWYDSSGAEIGDKCAWNFQSCVNLPNGSWQLQTEWSNAINGCVQQ